MSHQLTNPGVMIPLQRTNKGFNRGFKVVQDFVRPQYMNQPQCMNGGAVPLSDRSPHFTQRKTTPLCINRLVDCQHHQLKRGGSEFKKKPAGCLKKTNGVGSTNSKAASRRKVARSSSHPRPTLVPGLARCRVAVRTPQNKTERDGAVAGIWKPRGNQPFGCGSKPMVPFWGMCTTHFRTYFSGVWDVHCTFGLLTHGHLGGPVPACEKHSFQNWPPGPR